MSENGPVICDVKIELYSSNSGKLSQTIEEKLLLQDAGAVATLDYLLSTLHGEWDEYYVTSRPATCGDCKDCDSEHRTCPYSLNVDTASKPCHFFEMRD